MGRKTRGELMEEAGLSSGNLDGESFIRTWLDNWLFRTAKTWPWPVLKARINMVALAAGEASLQVGGGNGGVDAHIHRLLGGVVFYRAQTGFNPNGRILVRPFESADPSRDISVTDPLQRRGLPETVRIYTGDGNAAGEIEIGSITLVFDPVPNQALYLAFDAHYIPENLTSGSAGDTERPWYPNDRTLVEACKCALLDLDKGDQTDPAFDRAMGALGAMVVDDRDFDGDQAGDNQWLQLDPSVFR